MTLNLICVIHVQVTLFVKGKTETELMVHLPKQLSSSMLHILFVSKALSMLKYPKLLPLKETESTGNAFRTVWLLLIEATIDEALEQILIKDRAQFFIKGRANTNGTIVDAYTYDGHRLNQYIGKKQKDIHNKMNVEATVRTSKGNSLKIIRRYNPNGKNRDKISVLRTNVQRKLAGTKQPYQLYRIRWNIKQFNKAEKSGSNLKSIYSSKKNIILIFILLSLLVSLIKTYCAAKIMISLKIDDLSLLKVHAYNALYVKLLFTFAYRNRSTIYQIFKELLGEIALSCKHPKPSQRALLLIKALPLLLWQLVNQPGFKRKIS